MDRIMVIGGSGAGKSTLARKLGAKLDLPVVHFDRLHFLPGWVEKDVAERDREFADVSATARWVIDGNYSATWPERVARATLIIRLDIPLWRRVIRILVRSWRFRGTSRPDLADGCPEQFNWATLSFLWFVVKVSRRDPNRIRHLADPMGVPVISFTSNTQADAWVNEI